MLSVCGRDDQEFLVKNEVIFCLKTWLWKRKQGAEVCGEALTGNGGGSGGASAPRSRIPYKITIRKAGS